MTILFSLALTASIFAKTSPEREAWITELLGGKPAQSVLMAHERHDVPKRALPPPTEVKVTGGSSFLVLDPAFGPIREKADRKVSLLLAERSDMDAYSYITSLRREHPQYDDLLLDLAIECELRSSHWSEAYRDAVIYMQAGGFGGEEPKLYLSLASAALGCVYPGQARFCEKWIEDHLKNDGPSLIFEPTLKELDAHEVMVLSCLALGTKGSPEFAEMALRLDPVNVIAARRALYYYRAKGRYTDFRRVASSVAEHLPVGKVKSYYLQQIAAVAKLKDRPQHPVINP